MLASDWGAQTYIRRANQLLASGRELDVHHGRHMTLLNVLGPAEVSRIKDVDVVIWIQLATLLVRQAPQW